MVLCFLEPRLLPPLQRLARCLPRLGLELLAQLEHCCWCCWGSRGWRRRVKTTQANILQMNTCLHVHPKRSRKRPAAGQTPICPSEDPQVTSPSALDLFLLKEFPTATTPATYMQLKLLPTTKLWQMISRVKLGA